MSTPRHKGRAPSNWEGHSHGALLRGGTSVAWGSGGPAPGVQKPTGQVERAVGC